MEVVLEKLTRISLVLESNRLTLYMMNQKKKILFIMTALNGGGAEKVLVALLQNFDYTHFDVELLLTQIDGVHQSKLPQNIKVKTIYASKFLRRILLYIYRKLGNVYLIKRRLHRLCSEDYDTIVSFMEGEALLHHTCIVSKSNNNVTWVHTNLNMHHWTKWLFYQNDEEKCYNMMQQIIFVSHDAKKQFGALYALSPQIHQSVINNFVDTKTILKLSKEQAKIKKRKFTICTLARLSPPKALDRLILATKLLKCKGYNIDVWILGSGRLYDTLKNMILENDLEDVVHLLGFFSNPYSILKQADLFVCTSNVEGFSIAISEALILGLPVVSTNIKGVNELLCNGEYGLLTEENADDIANKLEFLITNENMRTEYAKKSIVRAEQLFQIQKQLDNYYSILNKKN